MHKPRHAQDIVLKHLIHALPHDALAALGIEGVHVVQALPTEFDEVDIKQSFADVVFEVDDGRMVHLEFQSTKEPNLHRFLRYDSLLHEKYIQPIRTIVLYTSGVKDAPEQLDAGTLQYHVENVFLHHFDGDHLLDEIENHIQHDDWTDQDRIRLAFALHMRYERMTQEEAFERVMRLVQTIPDPSEQNFTTTVILAISGRMMTKEQEDRLKEALKMTNIVREIEQEAKEEGRKEGLEQGLEQGHEEEKREIARMLLKLGDSVEKISKATGLSAETIEQLKNE